MQCRDAVQGLSESGVWRRLQKWRLRRRRTRAHLTRPEEAYRAKVVLLERAKAQSTAGEIELLYGDEHTFYRQPLGGTVWHDEGGGGAGQPTRERAPGTNSTNTKRRTLAAMNARTGQLIWKGCSKTGVPQICRFLR